MVGLHTARVAVNEVRTTSGTNGKQQRAALALAVNTRRWGSSGNEGLTAETLWTLDTHLGKYENPHEPKILATPVRERTKTKVELLSRSFRVIDHVFLVDSPGSAQIAYCILPSQHVGARAPSYGDADADRVVGCIPALPSWWKYGSSIG